MLANLTHPSFVTSDNTVTVLFKKFKKVILTSFFCFSASAEQRMEAAIADTVAGVGKAKNIYTNEGILKKPCVGKVTFLAL